VELIRLAPIWAWRCSDPPMTFLTVLVEIAMAAVPMPREMKRAKVAEKIEILRDSVTMRLSP